MSVLEGMGFRVGQGLIERLMSTNILNVQQLRACLKCLKLLSLLSRLTRDSPSFKDELDIMKFICKDFWTKVFRRQVDNLRTNHQVKLK